MEASAGIRGVRGGILGGLRRGVFKRPREQADWMGWVHAPSPDRSWGLTLLSNAIIGDAGIGLSALETYGS